MHLPAPPELEYLPGGFHACALSTAFDTEECSLVRCAAGAVFAELLGHVNAAGSGRVLWPRYAGQPAAGAAAAAEDTAEPDSVSANNGVAAVDECVTCIVELLECHRFAVTWDDALSVFWRLTESGDHNRSHASWRLLRMFCTIGVQMVRLGKESAVHELQGEFRLVNGVLRLLAAIQKVPSYRSVHLLVEICRFVAAAMRWAADMLETLVQEEPTVVTALLQMMRPSFYEDVSDELAAMALGGLCRLFVPLSTHGMCVIEVADQSVEHVKTLMRLAAYALDGERSDHFAASVLVILQNMVQCTATSADGSSEALHPFCDLLDTVMVEDERKKGSDPESAAKMCFRVLNALRKRSKSMYNRNCREIHRIYTQIPAQMHNRFATRTGRRADHCTAAAAFQPRSSGGRHREALRRHSQRSGRRAHETERRFVRRLHASLWGR